MLTLTKKVVTVLSIWAAATKQRSLGSLATAVVGFSQFRRLEV